MAELLKVPPLQAASEALRHFEARCECVADAEVPRLAQRAAQMVAQLAVMCEAEGVDFRYVLRMATAVYKTDAAEYRRLRQERRIYLPGEGA